MREELLRRPLEVPEWEVLFPELSVSYMARVVVEIKLYY